MTATILLGSALCFAFPVLLLIFGILFARQAEMDSGIRRGGGILIGAGLLGIALYTLGGLTGRMTVCWAAIFLVAVTALLVGLFLRGSLKQPLRAVSWILLTDALVVAAFLPYTIWIAGLALRTTAYNNPNETEVRAALRTNPNDAAAHSSLAHIDMMRGDHSGEMAEWQEVLRVEPENEDAEFLLASELLRAHRPDEARSLYQKIALGNGPYHDSAQKWLARHGG